MREKEAHHGIERRREGRNRVFNGGLPKGVCLANEKAEWSAIEKRKRRSRNDGCSCFVPLRLDGF